MIPMLQAKNERWKALVAFGLAASTLVVFACEATSASIYMHLHKIFRAVEKSPEYSLSTTGRKDAAGFAERMLKTCSVFDRRTLRQTEGRNNKRRAWGRCDESRVMMARGLFEESSLS